MMSIFIFAIKKFGTRLAMSLISDKFIEWAFFEIGKRIVQSTKTPHDDIWFAKLEEEYKNAGH